MIGSIYQQRFHIAVQTAVLSFGILFEAFEQGSLQSECRDFSVFRRFHKAMFFR